MEALHFSKDSENSRSSLQPTPGYNHELLQLPQGGCGDLLLYSQMCLRCFSHTSVDLCCTSSCLVWAQCHQNRPAPYETPIFLLKTWAVTGHTHHPFNLWALVNEGILLWQQIPLVSAKTTAFYMDRHVLHRLLLQCLRGYRVSMRKKPKLFCSYNILGWGIKVRKKKAKLLSSLCSRLVWRWPVSKVGRQRKNTYLSKHGQQLKTVPLWRSVCILITLYVPTKTARSIKPIISGRFHITLNPI